MFQLTMIFISRNCLFAYDAGRISEIVFDATAVFDVTAVIDDLIQL